MRSFGVEPLPYLVLTDSRGALESRNEQRIESIPTGGVFVEYEPPPEAPPEAVVINYKTGKTISGTKVSYEWIVEGEPRSYSAPDKQLFSETMSVHVDRMDDLKWRLETPVTPKLVELYIVDTQGFDLDAPIETLRHIASCQINGISLNGKLPDCLSTRDNNGNWEVTTPTAVRADKPLYALLSAWWQHYPEASSDTEGDGKEESSILWAIWIFKISGESPL